MVTGGFRRCKHSATVSHDEDVRMAMHGGDFVCLSDDDGLIHIDTLHNSKIHSERHGNNWIRRFGCEKSSVVEPCV